LLFKPISRDGASQRFNSSELTGTVNNHTIKNRRLAPSRLIFVLIRAIRGFVT